MLEARLDMQIPFPSRPVCSKPFDSRASAYRRRRSGTFPWSKSCGARPATIGIVAIRKGAEARAGRIAR